MRKVLAEWGLAVLVIQGLALAGWANAADGEAGGAKSVPATAAVLVYRAEEDGLEPYISRTLVNEHYLRMDQGGEGDEWFVLLDRRQATIYSVSPDDRTILVLRAAGPPPLAPAHLELTERGFEPDGTAETGERRLSGYEFLANGEVCQRVVVLPGAMAEAVTGLREYSALLAVQQGETMGSIPEEMQSPCDLARYVYAPARDLRHGLPIESWESGGKRRLLLHFDPDAEVSADLFALPEGYVSYTLEEMRKRAFGGP